MFDLSVGHKGFLLPELYDSPSFTYLNTSSSVQSFHSLCKKPSLPIEVMVRAVYLYRMEGVVNDRGIPSPFAELAEVRTVDESRPVCGWTLLAKDIWSVEDLKPLKWRTPCSIPM
jgi:hypothetical protein